MEHLETKSIINESRLDNRHYFQSLFQEACQSGVLSEAQIEGIQLELVDLMGKEIERYTNDESSSVKVEKAQEILQSITYNIGFFLKTTTDMTQKIDILKSKKISELFQKGMEAVNACKMMAERRLRDLQKNCLKLNHYAYQDTIFTGLPEFFHNYNIEFGADEIPASIDYQLFQEITDLIGIEYMDVYLDRFTKEDKFLRYFLSDNINRLLKAFDQEAEHMLVNIYELVLYNALGCILLDRKAKDLEIREEELFWLQENLEKLTKEELSQKLEYALAVLKQEMLPEPEVFDYARTALSQFAGRLIGNLQTKTLNKIFIVFSEVSREITYDAGIPMEDVKLRILIEQLKHCTNTSDKVGLMRQKISSMADFTELIEECFYEEEYDEVFQALSENESAALLKILQLEAGLEYGRDYEPEELWKKRFLRFGNN